MSKQIRIWHYKAELARVKETGEFEDRVNKSLNELGDKVENVYTIGVGHDLVVTVVLDVKKKEDNDGTDG